VLLQVKLPIVGEDPNSDVDMGVGDEEFKDSEDQSESMGQLVSEYS